MRQLSSLRYDADGEPTLPIGEAVVYRRRVWNPVRPRCAMDPHTGPIYRLTVHHTAGPTLDPLPSEDRGLQIQQSHQLGRGWCDVGYPYLVSRDGRLWEGRRVDRIGAHAFGANDRNLGISFPGTVTEDQPSLEQLRRVARPRAGLQGRFSDIVLAPSHVKGHPGVGGH